MAIIPYLFKQRVFSSRPRMLSLDGLSLLRSGSGLTLIEILVVLSVLLILIAAALPMTHVAALRSKEVNLKFHLRQIRSAIDAFKHDWDREGDQRYGPLCIENEDLCDEISSENGFPLSLEDLLMVDFSKNEEEKTKRYLRAIPVDPMTGTNEWGRRCYRDAPDTKSWCGEDIFDVFSQSDEIALNETNYSDW